MNPLAAEGSSARNSVHTTCGMNIDQDWYTSYLSEHKHVFCLEKIECFSKSYLFGAFLFVIFWIYSFMANFQLLYK